jgi:hypothetical protein
MIKQELCSTYHDFFEYNGNTEISRIRRQKGASVIQDWLLFDSADEAMEYFNTNCGECIDTYH